MKNKNIKTILIDGYLDEPSCLGVPPYISPHIRYTYGALISAGIERDNLIYRTIDQLRENWQENLDWMEGFDLVIIIAGTTVPGHYLGGKPISLTEINELSQKLYYPQRILGGPLTLVRKDIEGFDYICDEIAALNIYQILADNIDKTVKIEDLIRTWSIKGAELTKKHPNYPNLVCEIETFRGCPRSGHCAFCSERLKNIKYHRTPGQVIEEIKALSKNGNHNYRLGCQTDILLYQSQKTSDSCLAPNVTALRRLYQGIREADPGLKVLHLDNMNPANITKYDAESKEILKIITSYNTTGDVAAFGLESADPLVLQKNNIATDPEDTLKAIRIVNEIGGKREQGIPKLLPGLNFLHGLIGEREATMEYNYQFLRRVLAEDLLLRRINIRQVVRLGSYPKIDIDYGKFKEYKNKINEDINKPLLQKVFPTGTIIKNVLTEKHRGKLTYGRQLGSYPILIGIPGKLQLNKYVSVRVIDHGYRSLTALPWPFYTKEASIEQLEYIPGIGKNRAGKIFINQPQNLQELKNLLGARFPFNKWKDWFKF